jgi:hypothetical protein
VAKRSLGSDIREQIEARGWTRIEQAEWEELRGLFAVITENTLRKHASAPGVAIGQPWRGLDTASLESLELSLIEMAEAYLTHPREARRAVISTKDTTRFAARNPKVAADKRELKAEMVEWMLVWLGDPAMFEDWVKLRRAYLQARRIPINSALRCRL